jgi:phage-related protein
MAGQIFPRPVAWIGSSKKDFASFPEEVQAEMGYALYLAQTGQRHRHTKMLKGLPSGTLEVLVTSSGGTYRMIYTIRFPSVVFVLHAFQKKSKSGIATPKFEMDIVQQRLRDAEEWMKGVGR